MVSSIITGIILILIGLGFLMKETMGFDFNFYLKTYWPSALIILGLAKLFHRKSSKIGGIALILMGGLLQANFLNFIDYNIWKLFWPILLILFGISLLIPKKHKDNKEVESFTYDETISRPNHKNISSENLLRETVILSGLSTRNQSTDFKGGTITSILGGIDIDLRGAEIQEEEVVLQVSVLLGEVDILVPPHWRVEIHGTPILGGWNNKTYFNDDLNAPVLKIKAFVALGGLDVK